MPTIGELVPNMLNRDLLVHLDKIDGTLNQGSLAHLVDLESFKRSDEMAAWEMYAYDSYGQERCEREGINELGDLFGSEFMAVWNQRRNVLYAQHYLAEYEAELIRTQKKIARLRDVIANPPSVFPYPD